MDFDRHLCVHQGFVYAYGGENGTITVLPLSDLQKSTVTASARSVHKYDDPVRALAFSQDGQRVAVGFDDGNVDVYSFSLDQLKSEEDGSSLPHPFARVTSGKDDASKEDSSQDDGLGDLFTQGDDEDAEGLFSSSDKLAPTFRLKHRQESSIRSLQFDPKMTGKYFLAIASDSSPGFIVVDATSETSTETYLSDESVKCHNEDGLRSLSYSPDGSTIATMTHKGRLCMFNIEGDDPEIDWELRHRDGHIAVQKPDMSAFQDFDSGDRSIGPVWSTDGLLLGLPGEKDLHFRWKGGDEFKRDFMILPKMGNDSINGELVGMAFDPLNEGYVVTSSRDGMISVWKICDSDKGLVSRLFPLPRASAILHPPLDLFNFHTNFTPLGLKCNGRWIHR